MLTNENQKAICKQYSKLDAEGHKQCNLCPLCISVVFNMCHANSHYDPIECEFVLDDFGEENYGSIRTFN